MPRIGAPKSSNVIELDIDGLIEEQKQKQQERLSGFMFLNDIANSLNTDPSNFRKYAKAKGISIVKVRDTRTHNQLSSAVTKKDAQNLIKMRFEEGYSI